MASSEKKSQLSRHEIPPRTFKPYETTHLETPLWNLIVAPLCLGFVQPLFSQLYHVRELVAPPMKTVLVPRIMAAHLPSSVAFLTVGDLILLVPLVLWGLLGMHYTFVAPALNLSGSVAAYSIYYAFLTASKSNSPFSFFLGIPYERLIGIHRAAAVLAAFLGSCHAYVAYNYGGDDDGDSKYSKASAAADEDMDPNLLKFLWDGQSNWSGSLVLFSICALLLMSFFAILRRFSFNMWYFLHVVLGIAVVVGLLLHSVQSAVLVTAWWALDMLVRYGVLAGMQNRVSAQIRKIVELRKPDDFGPHEAAVEIVVKKPPHFAYNAGQFVRLAVPEISPMEFHPISISSAPHEENITMHVRSLGDWTDQLVRLAESKSEIQIAMEGPYGSLSVDLEDDFKYKMVLFVTGGIGVTPCQSIGKHLLHTHRIHGRRLKEMRFVWAVRDLQMVQDIPPLFLNDDPQENYSKSSPEYQRMMERIQSLKRDESTMTASVKSSTMSHDQSSHGTRPRRAAPVQVDVYRTRGKEHAEDAEAGTETTTTRPYNLYKGRPDLDAILEQMKADAKALGETNVAVIGCGPGALMVDLQKACLKHSSSVVGCGRDVVFFDMHKEHFEL